MTQRRMQIVHFEKGAVIFRQGDTDKVLYKILNGKVGIYLDYGGEQQRQLSVLPKDRCFGEMSILEDCPRSATAVAEEEVSVAVYPERLMTDFIYQNPGFALELMKNLSARLRSSTNELEEMHGMLLQLTEQKTANQKMKEYVRRHTIYEADGTARFCIKL